MFKKEELGPIAIILIVLTIIIGDISDLTTFSYSFLIILLVLAINIFAKKISSYYLDSQIQIKLWTIKRFGFKAHHKLKREFPAGIIFPIIISTLSFGIINWFACLTFDVKAKASRAAKKYGIYSFSEMTEYHIALIVASGIAANLIFAVIGYLIGFPLFAKINIYYAFFNMIPISDLDGNQMFFGSNLLWSFLAAITLIFVGYAIFLV